MTATIANSLGMEVDPRKWRRTLKVADNSSYVGVEIELEHLRYFGTVEKMGMQGKGLWNVVKDGSLRDHGLEFIMSTPNGQPLKAGDIIRALMQFKKGMEEYETTHGDPPRCTVRTSLHIHVDVRDLEIPQLQKFILLYVVFEKILFNHADPSRYHNAYCRSIGLHQDVQERLAQVVKSSASGHGLASKLEKGNKYDAMNVLSVRQRGSMEFRLMRGTYDTKLILEWINILLALKNAARDETIVIDSFPEDMSQRGPANLVEQVFGKWGAGIECTDMEVLEGIREAQDILLHFDQIELNESFMNHSEKEHAHLNAFKAKLKEV